MANLPEQEKTAHRRPEILDADFVPREEVPHTPRAKDTRRGGRVSPVTTVAACIVLLAMALAVSRGDGAGRSGEGDFDPKFTQEARWSAAVIDDGAGTPAEETLGAALETLSAPVAAYYSMRDCPQVPGAQVCAVEPDGIAAEAGFAPGDVITAVNGKAILTTEELSDALCSWDGEEVLFTVYRSGKTVEITAFRPSGPGG